MNIQLYQVDENDNYLVDFRNVGYRAIPHQRQSPSLGSESGSDSQRSSFTLPPNVADEIRAKAQQSVPAPIETTSLRQSHIDRGVPTPRATGVSSPFLFLECACKLIVELAVGVRKQVYRSLERKLIYRCFP